MLKLFLFALLAIVYTKSAKNAKDGFLYKKYDQNYVKNAQLDETKNIKISMST